MSLTERFLLRFTKQWTLKKKIKQRVSPIKKRAPYNLIRIDMTPLAALQTVNIPHFNPKGTILYIQILSVALSRRRLSLGYLLLPIEFQLHFRLGYAAAAVIFLFGLAQTGRRVVHEIER